jgi:hypothetical protein
MAEQNEQEKNPIISTRTDLEFKAALDEAAELRGHTRSQALEEIMKLGFPRYMKKFPQKYERVDTAA